MQVQELLSSLRSRAGTRDTSGLPDATIERLAKSDPDLPSALESALEAQKKLISEYPDLYKQSEHDLRKQLQKHYVNFYPADSVSPYVPLAAKGPWIVTTHGAVIYDTGGYGMLGLGHNPDELNSILGAPQVMANIMTPSFSQHRFYTLLKTKIGIHRRDRSCPYPKILCMNSGSESVAVAMRISDLNAKTQTDPGSRYEGREVKVIGLQSGFHGRAGRAAHISSSSLKYYMQLASFRDRKNLLTVTPNDVSDLKRVFVEAEQSGCYIEAMVMEPVMGEGNPGVAITPEFYAEARALTRAHGSLLIVDSIQAGLRAHGVLSIVDYPGFSELEAPDMETFSKAINAGQFPMSVLAMTDDAAAIYKTGVYGNTMTANPRGLDIACAVLERCDTSLEKRVKVRGAEFLQKLEALKANYPTLITAVHGTGLLLSAGLTDSVSVTGFGGLEEQIRLKGINVIHGGTNALRFTPCFTITSEQIDLILEVVESALASLTP